MANYSLNDLELESDLEPFVFDLPDGDTITFPDPTDLPIEQAESFMSMFTGEVNASFVDLFQTWLSEEDFDKLNGLDLSMRKAAKLVELVGQHYSSIFGTPGN